MTAARPLIELWLMPTDAIDADLHQRLLTGLSERENAEHDRHTKETDRLLYAASHALKRHALSARFGGPPYTWTFTDGPYGKPLVSNPPDGASPRFNLSHTPGLVAVATADGIELGLDVEALDPTHADLDTAQAFAHPSEYRALGSPGTAAFIADFYRLWTRKEALAKATGLGLSLEVRQLIFEDEIIDHWHLYECDEPPAHRLALVAEVKAGTPEIVVKRLEPIDLVQKRS